MCDIKICWIKVKVKVKVLTTYHIPKCHVLLNFGTIYVANIKHVFSSDNNMHSY